MLPLLKPGDEVLVNPRAYRGTAPRPGDIVVARHPFQPELKMIKRVSAVLDNGHYQLQGDNPAESNDSRMFGPVTGRHILGRVEGRFA
jgi:nickel-type superoxide dismutase maturation protease